LETPKSVLPEVSISPPNIIESDGIEFVDEPLPVDDCAPVGEIEGDEGIEHVDGEDLIQEEALVDARRDELDASEVSGKALRTFQVERYEEELAQQDIPKKLLGYIHITAAYYVLGKVFGASRAVPVYTLWNTGLNSDELAAAMVSLARQPKFYVNWLPALRRFYPDGIEVSRSAVAILLLQLACFEIMRSPGVKAVSDK